MDSERQSQIEASLRRHLDAGNEMLDGTDQLEAGQLHAWATRTTSLARDLADCVGDPIRNRVMELLDRPTIPDDANALMVLRITAGLSHRALGQKAGPRDRCQRFGQPGTARPGRRCQSQGVFNSEATRQNFR